MLAEHWVVDETGETLLMPAGNPMPQVLLGGNPVEGVTPRHCCTIEGETWEDCLRAYHVHMGWPEYRPMPKRADGE